MSGHRPSRLGLVAFWLAWGVPAAYGQQVSYTVTFDDPNQTATDLYAPITSHLLAAGARWGDYLRPAANVTLEVTVSFSTSVPRATGRSTTSSFYATSNGFNVYEQGAGAEIRTGVDPNQSNPDIEFVFNPDYARNQLWFDPDPAHRAAAVPGDRTDAMSVMLHELGHAFAFNGWRDGTTGALPGNYMSTFDRHVTTAGGVLDFNGPEAMKKYGGQPVPLTLGNYAHLGNSGGLPGGDLIPDLMNGVVFTNGTRYDISGLDVAVLSDSGVPVEVPVPEPLLTLAAVAAVWSVRPRRVSRGSSATTPA